jgi:hypothetical protein
MSASNKKNAGLADDDRNLVLVDGDFSDADLDDRMWLLWERYKTAALLGAGVLFVAGISFIAWRSLRASHAETIGAAYNTATTPELKMTFAERNQGEPLAAVAALESADAAYTKADYKEASNRYGRAALFADTAKPRAALVSARALIGSAVCEIRSGNTAEGVKRLTAIADTAPNEQNASLRAHALFILAENACGEKDFVSAKKYLDRLDRETTDALAWSLPSSPKSQLTRAFPELLTVGAAPATK